MKDTVTPFLKWAGGKRWLTKELANYFPEDYNDYFEPFLGSGAVFFSLLPENAILSDINSNLILTYKAIKEDYGAVYRRLEKHSERHNKDYYYEIRSKEYTCRFDLAARFIYLNRTCFNGLYRVNLKGKFNVPIGSKDTVILNTDNFEDLASHLRNAEIIHSDFESIIDLSKEGDLVYIDPPYTVKHNNNGFVKYNEKMFTWEDQVRLSKAVKRAKERGVQVVISNADHSSIKELYSFVGEINFLSRHSVIASNSANRGKYSELLIRI